MPLENRPIPIKFRGVFDWNQLYHTWINWMKSQLMKYHENIYKDKPTAGNTREIELDCMGEVKIDEFHKWIVKVSIHIWDATPVEVVQEGKKRQMLRGRIYIIIKAEVLRDYQGVYDHTPLLQRARGLILKMTEWEEKIPIWDTYYYKTIKLHSLLKQALGMDTGGNPWQDVTDG